MVKKDIIISDIIQNIVHVCHNGQVLICTSGTFADQLVDNLGRSMPYVGLLSGEMTYEARALKFSGQRTGACDDRSNVAGHRPSNVVCVINLDLPLNNLGKINMKNYGSA